MYPDASTWLCVVNRWMRFGDKITCLFKHKPMYNINDSSYMFLSKFYEISYSVILSTFHPTPQSPDFWWILSTPHSTLNVFESWVWVWILSVENPSEVWGLVMISQHFTLRTPDSAPCIWIGNLECGRIHIPCSGFPIQIHSVLSVECWVSVISLGPGFITQSWRGMMCLFLTFNIDHYSTFEHITQTHAHRHAHEHAHTHIVRGREGDKWREGGWFL